jgi:hypothetical protein
VRTANWKRTREFPENVSKAPTVPLTSAADDDQLIQSSPTVHGAPVKTGCPWPDRAVHEGSLGGPELMGIITWKHELLVVPFSAEWAA